MIRKTTSTAVLLLILSTLFLSASTPSDQGSESSVAAVDPYFEAVMQPFVVTATRAKLPLSKSPVITRVIESGQIERLGYTKLEDILERELAGLEFHQAGYGPSISFQGLDARYVLFMVDGERISGETYGNVDYSRIPLNTIERIEIVKGASSVLYGSSAMGAVVNIITKSAMDRAEVSGSFRYGSKFDDNYDEMLWDDASVGEYQRYLNKLNMNNIDADISVGIRSKNKKLSSLTSGSFKSTDAYKLIGRGEQERHYDKLTLVSMFPMPPSTTHTNDTTVMIPADGRGLGVSAWQNWYVGQKIEYKVDDKFRLELSGNYFEKERHDFYTSIMDENPMSGMIPTNDTLTYETYKGYSTKFLMEHTPHWKHSVTLSFMRDENFRYENNFLGDKTPKQRHTFNIPRLLWTYETNGLHRLTTGVELINERLKFDLNQSGGFGDAKSLNTIAVYAQGELFRENRLSLFIGARGEWNDKFGLRATPSISGKYSHGALSGHNFNIRANYSMGFRNPSLKEMYMLLDLPISNAPVIYGNPDLKAETNHFLSLSFEYANRSFYSFSLTASQSFFKDKIDVVHIGQQGSGASQKTELKYGNIDSNALGSLEFIGRVRLAKGLILKANYNFIYQNDYSASSDSQTQYIYPSRHTALASLSYTYRWRSLTITPDFNIRYVGSKDYSDFMTYIALDKTLPLGISKIYTGVYTSRMDGYALCNFALNIDYSRRVSLTLGLNNIFNYCPEVVSFNAGNMPGRNGFVKVAFNL